MTREIQLSRGNSPFVGRLVKGCRECIKGAKLVLFITGNCSKACFYCPISEERQNLDVIYANEVAVNDINQALEEARLIDAMGMGITGGEPLLEPERTHQFIKAFKRKFGSDFHIHLYTGLEPVPLEVIERLLDAGLDEIRLHRFKVGADYPELRKITKGRAKLGIEIPAIPGKLKQLKTLLRDFEEVGIDFVNINELEFTPLNAEALKQQGLHLESDSIASVRGSENEALKLVEWAAAETELNVHFCPLSLKDGTQLRNRFRRRAKNVAQPFEQITKEGLLKKGIITLPAGVALTEVRNSLRSEYQIPQDKIWINEKQKRIETSTTIIKKLAKSLKARGFQVGIVEEYPIASRFQVSYTPL
ncbi:MAG: radical SAM protein [Candidatus Hermodarchaeota archaeon]